MASVLINETSLTSIGNAIRSKLDVETLYTPSEMATAINSIPSGITPSGSITLTANGTYDVTSKASAVVALPSASGVSF